MKRDVEKYMAPLGSKFGGSNSGMDSAAIRRVDEARNLIDLIDPHVSSLVGKEAKFVADIKSRLREFGDDSYISQKQIFWLRDIKDKIVEGRLDTSYQNRDHRMTLDDD